MTIAAGFRYGGGVLLCADSQYTYGDVSKTEGGKIASYALPHAPVHVGFAICGSVPHAKLGIREILGAVVDHNSATMRDVLNAMQVGHEQAYERVLRHPKYQLAGSSEYWLLISLWVQGEGAALFVTDDDAITPVSNFECKGSGDYLFRYLMECAYRADLTLEQIVSIVAHAFEEIKAYDPNVGFNSEFMRADSQTGDFSNVAGYDIGHVENFGRVLQRSMYDLLFAMADLRTSADAVERAKQSFEDNLANLRRRYTDDKQHRNSVLRLVQFLEQPGSKKLTIQFKR